MRNLNKLELSVVGGADGEPQPISYPPTQSRQEVDQILDALRHLYAGPGGP